MKMCSTGVLIFREDMLTIHLLCKMENGMYLMPWSEQYDGNPYYAYASTYPII